MENSPDAASDNHVQLQKPKSRLLVLRDRLLSPHLKEYRPHAAESLHQRQVLLHGCIQQECLCQWGRLTSFCSPRYLRDIITIQSSRSARSLSLVTLHQLSCFVPDIFAIKLRSPKIGPNFDVFRLANF